MVGGSVMRMLVLMVAVFLSAIGTVPSMGGELYFNIHIAARASVKLDFDPSASVSLNVFQGQERIFVTTHWLDPNPTFGKGAKDMSKRGFFLPAGGGSKCYDGPSKATELNNNIFGKGTSQTRVCLTLKVAAKQWTFKYQEQKVDRRPGTNLSGGQPLQFVHTLDASGTIAFKGDGCTAKLTSFQGGFSRTGWSPTQYTTRLGKVDSTTCYFNTSEKLPF